MKKNVALLEGTFYAAEKVSLTSSEIAAGNFNNGFCGPLVGLGFTNIEEKFISFIKSCNSLDELISNIYKNKRVESQLYTNRFTKFQHGTGFKNFTKFRFYVKDSIDHKFSKETDYCESGLAYFFFYPRNLKLRLNGGSWCFEVLTRPRQGDRDLSFLLVCH